MTDTMSRSKREAQYIYDMAPWYDMRTGQFLFNFLRHEVAEVVKGTELDTFYKNLEAEEIEEWLEKHIIYNNQGRMVRLHNGPRILWEEEMDD